MSCINYDYHMHPNLMNVPENGRMFIESAIEAGLKEICFTDHAPLSRFPLKDRVPFGEARRYCYAVRELADEYKDRITVKCGIEMDYIPALENEIEDILSQADFDYVIGSSHLHVDGMLQEPLSELTADEYAAKCYKNNLLAVKSGYFHTIAHLDMYRWIARSCERFKLRTAEFDLSLHEEAIRELFGEMEKRGIALEINTHLMASTGIAEDIYPSPEVMRIAREYDLKYKFGSDAHHKGYVGFGRDIICKTELFKDCFCKPV